MKIIIKNPKRDEKIAEIRKALFLSGLSSEDIAKEQGRNKDAIVRLLNLRPLSPIAPQGGRYNRNLAMKALMKALRDTFERNGIDYTIEED